MLPTPSLDSLLAELNEQQRAAAGHPRDPLLIIAGAGTGKTATLAHRVAWLIATGADPGRILLLTFTRRAAAEMLRRVDQILERSGQKLGRAINPGSVARRIWGGTFHAVASRLLRLHCDSVGLPRAFTILDRGDSEDLMQEERAAQGLGDSKTRFPLKGTCLDIYSRCVNCRKPLAEVTETAFPWCRQHIDALKGLFHAYVDRKESLAVLDYDDLLLYWHALFEKPETAEVIRSRFDAILVDEYQDTNALQAEILKGLAPNGQGLTVVGDDAQSIYSFRAATVRNILDFPAQFPGATVLALEQNYRSTQPILDATNAVMAQAQEGFRKNLWTDRKQGLLPELVHCQDEAEQTQFVVAQLLRSREGGTPLKRQAILFRAGHHSLDLELELARRNIPFQKYGGLRFVETAHVKDLLSFLRLAENPRDTLAGARMLQLIPGIGPKKAAQLLSKLGDARGDFRVWKDFSPPSQAGETWSALVEMMIGLSSPDAQTVPLASQVHRVRTLYAPLLEQKLDHAQARLRDLEQLEIVAGRFSDRTEFLADITLDPPTSTQELAADPLLDEDYVILSTIHSAKGLEWDSVYVIHAADGNIPSDMATTSQEEIEEERRLFYVALTRARDRLFVCYPQRYYFANRRRGDEYGFAQRTRFLPDEVTALFQDRLGIELDPLVQKIVEAASTRLSSAEVRDRLKQVFG
ncbi:MAG TPA: ATP-dependent helicase [Planctomycetaceae bacterium]|jgi:DNA helicase-2/ATP-dependent DNA helicase PcrA|nr:ATP-dependent helicase [Planctomycetaceae bacterium]